MGCWDLYFLKMCFYFEMTLLEIINMVAQDKREPTLTGQPQNRRLTGQVK